MVGGEEEVYNRWKGAPFCVPVSVFLSPPFQNTLCLETSWHSLLLGFWVTGMVVFTSDLFTDFLSACLGSSLGIRDWGTVLTFFTCPLCSCLHSNLCVSVVLKLQHAVNSFGVFLQTDCSLHLQSFWFSRSGMGPENCQALQVPRWCWCCWYTDDTLRSSAFC